MCCKDLWQLEVEKPAAPGRVQLVRASTNSLELCWPSVSTADGYLLQIQKYDICPGRDTPSQSPALIQNTLTTGTTTPVAIPQQPKISIEPRILTPATIIRKSILPGATAPVPAPPKTTFSVVLKKTTISTTTTARMTSVVATSSQGALTVTSQHPAPNRMPTVSSLVQPTTTIATYNSASQLITRGPVRTVVPSGTPRG